MKTWKTKSGYEIIRILSGRSNAFIINNGTACIMVDSSRFNQWRKLRRRLRLLQIERIDLLILTHSHFDHAENARKLKAEFHPQILIHQSEADYLRYGDSPLPQGTICFTRIILKLFANLLQPRLKYQGVDGDIEVASRLDLNPWGYNAYIIHTPGHTRGSMSLIIDDEIALVGDAMVGEIKNSIFQPFADDIGEAVRSWQRLLDTNCSTYLPAHGGAISRQLVLKEYERHRGKYF
ncbi:MAG: MBL fold metallo-hydrolase [Syntrophomonadaceae bacterium]|nr:MBL fold metallo-hydrolase [Syntrophomonadaceae bacterium]